MQFRIQLRHICRFHGRSVKGTSYYSLPGLSGRNRTSCEESAEKPLQIGGISPRVSVEKSCRLSGSQDIHKQPLKQAGERAGFWKGRKVTLHPIGQHCLPTLWMRDVTRKSQLLGKCENKPCSLRSVVSRAKPTDRRQNTERGVAVRPQMKKSANKSSGMSHTHTHWTLCVMLMFISFIPYSNSGE